ncbi:hypothetical protein [Aeromicrobium sp.]|uniref:hypothetical protein n=1 Tax=Aeromicrobium sp. TaxID=1871063 RepID=UPI00198D5E87|nr:hypothetical protein [Aeromicrobium sp.]MBC7631037.1 hypothetical protein [Aeromicrobium sp.]
MTVVAAIASVVLIAAGSQFLLALQAGDVEQRPAAEAVAAVPPRAPAGPPETPPGLEGLEKGPARVDPGAANAKTQLPPVRERTITRAVEAFVADAVWLLGSPVAEQNPAEAARVVSTVLNTADREMLARIPRGNGADLAAMRGAYRVLGHAGAQSRPDAVMVEVSAPLTTEGTERWLVAGGVVSWIEGRWQLQSLTPRDAGMDAGIASRSATIDSTTLPGLGWLQFANADLG